MNILKKHLAKYRVYMLLGPFFKLLEAAFELMIPLVTAQIIDKGIPSGSLSYIAGRLGIMVLLGVVGFGFSITCQYFAAVAGYGFGTDLRAGLMRHIQRLKDPDACGISAHSLAVRVNSDVFAIQSGVNMFVRLASRIPFIVIGAAVMSTLIDVKISAVFWATAVLIAVILTCISKITVKLHLESQRLTDSVATQSRETLSGMRVIRAFAQQENRRKRFDEDSVSLRKSQSRAAMYSALLNPVAVLVTNLAVVAILYFSGYNVNSGRLTQGETAALVNYMTQICLALIVFANLLSLFTRASASLRRVGQVFALEAFDDAETESGMDISRVDSIEFENISLRYPGSSADVLSDISFRLNRGETLGVIGGVGSGKTTLLKLITQSAVPTQGRILINGRDAREYNRQALSALTGHCFQYPRFYTASVYENLRRACPDLSEKGAEEMLKKARAWSFVSAKHGGIHEIIAEGGRNLSGGQKQRLSLARTFAHRHDILLLDDSTCALDYATEQEVLEEIRGIAKECCTILVSQRPATLRYADRILVLEDGRAAGLDTHEDLLASCPEYKEITDAAPGLKGS